MGFAVFFGAMENSLLFSLCDLLQEGNFVPFCLEAIEVKTCQEPLLVCMKTIWGLDMQI